MEESQEFSIIIDSIVSSNKHEVGTGDPISQGEKNNTYISKKCKKSPSTLSQTHGLLVSLRHGFLLNPQLTIGPDSYTVMLLLPHLHESTVTGKDFLSASL